MTSVPNVMLKMEIEVILNYFWCHQAFPRLHFSASWLRLVDLRLIWMAEMPPGWFHSCYSFKIFSTCEIIFHLCFNRNGVLKKSPMPWGLVQVSYTSLTHLFSAQQHVIPVQDPKYTYFFTSKIFLCILQCRHAVEFIKYTSFDSYACTSYGWFILDFGGSSVWMCMPFIYLYLTRGYAFYEIQKQEKSEIFSMHSFSCIPIKIFITHKNILLLYLLN